MTSRASWNIVKIGILSLAKILCKVSSEIKYHCTVRIMVSTLGLYNGDLKGPIWTVLPGSGASPGKSRKVQDSWIFLEKMKLDSKK